ncbi:hypothetical protein [Enterobacter hormaechei]|uniref:hypothetical protein n=1 Tax=Enterobacter hormaechei TaxID=158836 RepID=UPI0039061B5E
MLYKYFERDGLKDEEKHKRMIAVSAALEVAKASVSASNSDAGLRKVECDLQYVSSSVNELADAIQRAIEPIEASKK